MELALSCGIYKGFEGSNKSTLWTVLISLNSQTFMLDRQQNLQILPPRVIMKSEILKKPLKMCYLRKSKGQ